MNFTAVESSSPMRDESARLACRLREFIEMECRLCCHLEWLADNLPNAIDMAECGKISASIVPILCGAHEFEERELFPQMARYCSDADRIARTIERLREEHVEDETYAHELKEALDLFAEDPGGQDAERLGYMLRGFFEGLRRHIAFEREHLLPMLEGVAH